MPLVLWLQSHLSANQTFLLQMFSQPHTTAAPHSLGYSAQLKGALGPAIEPLREQMGVGQVKGMDQSMTKLPFTPEVDADSFLSAHQPPPTKAHKCSTTGLVPLETAT